MTRNPAIKGRIHRFSSTLNALLTNLASTGRGRKQIVSVAADSVLTIFALWFAYSLRHGQPFSDFASTWYLFIALPLISVAAFGALGVYRWVIRSTNQRLFKQLVKGCALSAIALILITFLIPPDRSNPRSLFVIYGLVLLCSTQAVRLIWQSRFSLTIKGEPIAIYGAGQGGCQLANMLSTGRKYRPVVFVDDNAALDGTMLFGLPVVSGVQGNLKAELNRHDVNRIVLAIPSLGGAGYREKLDSLESLGLIVQTMPTIDEMLSGLARADDIRDISIKDILGRTEVAQDRDLMAKRVVGKMVMVTGGGGSIGSELCRQIMLLNPSKLIVMDSSEENLYHISEELSTFGTLPGEHTTATADFLPVLGSVLNEFHVNRILREEAVDTVYHAAAYKHVPIVEAQPYQGARTNVFGTLTVLDAAIKNGVSDFVLISTDKAVRPTNAMGASKRVAELVLQAKARLGLPIRISMVRFGNVLGSSGSVVPKFKKQIEKGGPITLTDSGITRYFMTIPEAAQLVLQASSIATDGDVFVLDMGDPVRIEDLAISMVRLSGRQLKRDTGKDSDIDIVIEGLRPGEKMYEELFINQDIATTSIGKIFSANEVWLEWGVLKTHLEAMQLSVKKQEGDKVREQLMALALIEPAPSETGAVSDIEAQKNDRLSNGATV